MLAPFTPPTILIAEDGDGIAVTIVPSPTGPGHDRAFSDYLPARAYARLLRMEFGWQLVDRCDQRKVSRG